MNMLTLRAFFGWVTIFNAILLLYASFMSRFGEGFVWNMSHQWMPQLTHEQFMSGYFLLLGMFKLFVLAANLMPYLVLVILTRKSRAGS